MIGMGLLQGTQNLVFGFPDFKVQHQLWQTGASFDKWSKGSGAREEDPCKETDGPQTPTCASEKGPEFKTRAA